MKRLVCRPWLLRPPEERSPTVRLFSGRVRDSSTKSYAVWKRRPADVGLNFLTGITVPYTPSKNSSFSPGARRTYAFFQSLRWPRNRPMRFHFPWRLATRTSATLTPKSFSTARRISILLARRSTSKQTVLVASFNLVDFSEISGRRINCSGSIFLLQGRDDPRQSVLRDDDSAVAHHVVDVDREGVHELDLPHVAGSEVQVLVLVRVHEQRLSRDAEAADRGLQVLRLVALHSQALDDDQALLPDPLRERGLQRVLLLADGDLLGVGARRGAVRRSAVAVDRRTSASLPRAAGPFLLEGLLAGAGDFAAGLGLVRPGAEPREVRLHDLPHEVSAVR